MNNKIRWSAEILLTFGALVLGSCSFRFVSDSAASSNQTPASSTGDTTSATSEGGASSSSTGTGASSGTSMTGTSFSTATSASQSSSNSGAGANYYKATGDMTTSVFNYKYLANNESTDSLGTTGNKKILVLPIELTGYEFTTSILSDINTAFNGADGTGYWESLASFYKKSSFGAFTPSYTIGAKYVSGLTPQQLYAKNSDSLTVSSYILRQALANYKTVSGDDCTQYDSDSDGYIDAVIMIYSCPDDSQDATLAKLDSDSDVFWAFCYWDYDNYANRNTASPIGMNYFWMSYDFLYEESPSPKPDVHTPIHESGHLMGAPDYYSYDDTTYNGSTVTPSPFGGVAMMDENVTDHDAFTKLTFNWIKPYVVTGNATITINPAESSGDCILIPAKGTTWNGTAFDEYMLLELYTPTGLNQLDSTTKYSYDPQGYTTAGVRLMHIDSRISKCTYDSSGKVTASTFITGTPTTLPSSSTVACKVAQDNTPSRRLGQAKTQGLNLATLIQAGHPSNTLQYGLNKGDNKNLFTTGSSFDQTTHSSFFAKKTTFDNGSAFGYRINFDSVSATSATISFTTL
jgi:M6 family metalloprotease-like protein